MKPGTYEIGFATLELTIRIKDKTPNIATVIKVKSGAEVVKAKFINQKIYVDSIALGKQVMFYSKSAKPLVLLAPVESKALALIPT